jgi:hypothetical protein
MNNINRDIHNSIFKELCMIYTEQHNSTPPLAPTTPLQNIQQPFPSNGSANKHVSTTFVLQQRNGVLCSIRAEML